MDSKLIKETAIYGLGGVAPKVVGFLLLPIFTRYLTPTEYGIISYTNSVRMFLFVIAALGLNTFVLRHYFELKTEEQKKELIGNVFLFLCFFSLFITILAMLLFPFGIRYFNVQVPFKPFFLIALTNNFLDTFSILPLVYYRLHQNARGYVQITITRAFLQYALSFTFIVIFGWGVLGNYYGNLITLTIFAFVYWTIIIKGATLRINWQQIREGLIFSLPLIPVPLCQLIVSLSDKIIMERFISLSDMGIYSIAATLTLVMGILNHSVYKAVEPEIFKRYGDVDFWDFFKETKAGLLALLFLCAMGISLFSQEILIIMTPEKYWPGHKLIPVLAIGIIFSGINILYGCIIIAEKRTKISGISVFVGALTSVTFNLALIPKFGYYGAAVSSAFAYGAMNLFIYYYLPRKARSILKEAFLISVFIMTFYLIIFHFNLELSIGSVIIKLTVCCVYMFLIYGIYHNEINIAKPLNNITKKLK
jgi:O-antigen/teichoic acid export membrane protein